MTPGDTRPVMQCSRTWPQSPAPRCAAPIWSDVWGGEEFTVLLPATSIEAARRLAEKLRNRLQNSPTVWEGQTIACTASIGVAGTTALEKHDYDTLYRDADKALYVAKTQGRNRVV